MLPPALKICRQPAEKTQKKKNEQEIQNEVQKEHRKWRPGLEHKPDKSNTVFLLINLLKKRVREKSANTEHQLRKTISLEVTGFHALKLRVPQAMKQIWKHGTRILFQVE